MQSKVIFEKIIINVSWKLKKSLYLGTNFIFERVIIIRDGGRREYIYNSTVNF
jgi:hypothetical protein